MRREKTFRRCGSIDTSEVGRGRRLQRYLSRQVPPSAGNSGSVGSATRQTGFAKWKTLPGQVNYRNDVWRKTIDRSDRIVRELRHSHPIPAMSVVRHLVGVCIAPYVLSLKTTWIGLAVATFGILSFGLLKASYGRHYTNNMIIPAVDGKIGWMCMEIVSPIMALLFFQSYKIVGPFPSKGLILFALWMLHYSNRAVFSVLLSPHMKSSRLDIVLMSVVFNSINACWIGHDLGLQTAEPFLVVGRTRLGLVLFAVGALVNISSDYHLQSLRRQKDKKGEYVLSRWGLYKYIVSPNYAGEIVEWTGYALMLARESAWVFVLWSFCNLGPRARTNLAWYKEKFGKQVGKRKALIPWIY
jgi:3-oxo-5-alpha-steroid 4-dehydrogenase 1